MQFDSTGTRRSLAVGDTQYDYFSLAAAAAAGLGDAERIARLPYAARILLENLLRQHALGQSDGTDLDSFAAWLRQRANAAEMGFRPTRVMMPESSGLPLLGDLAAMRDAMSALGGDAATINPRVPVDVIVDHSVMVHESGHAGALLRNMRIEFEQNAERFAFLRWAATAFANLRVFPPGSGICHQINLEHLARVVWSGDVDGRRLAWPDSLIALDSHTAMINSLGVFGWGVGGLEGGAAVLGEPVAVLMPRLTGVRLTGRLRPGVTATDLVLSLTEFQRRHEVIGEFIEYCGPGVDTLALPDRATVSNMTPECGATMCLFPIDAETLRYLRGTGRDAHQLALIETYARAQGLWRDATTPIPEFDRLLEFDLASVEPCVAGPGRPDRRVPLRATRAAFTGATADTGAPRAPLPVPGATHTLGDGDVVIAAITSCTNTSNPAVMLAAGLLARNARARGLAPKPWVKTSLSPGSRVVAGYLEAAGLQDELDALGFQVTGFGCMTCIGHSGPLRPEISAAIGARQLNCVAVVSANRNFDARTHPEARANFLASPPLVLAYALAGTVLIDLETEALGHDAAGQPVYLRDIWPDDAEVRALIERHVTPELVRSRYQEIERGSPDWQTLAVPAGPAWHWDPASHFLLRPPFFEGMGRQPDAPADLRGARILCMLGDMVTTDHISPTGDIGRDTPAGRYLRALGVAPRDFVSYSARRLNHHVMTRGTFANVRLRNELVPGVEGSATLHFPGRAPLDIFAAAERYRQEGVPLVVVGGREYGAGSSRDWASKGTFLLGVRAVIAESFERIHRSNLVTMGVLPLEFPAGVTRQTLGLAGDEVIDLDGLASLGKRGTVGCTIRRATGESERVALLARIDSAAELAYWRHGGILRCVLRERLATGGAARV